MSSPPAQRRGGGGGGAVPTGLHLSTVKISLEENCIDGGERAAPWLGGLLPSLPSSIYRREGEGAGALRFLP